MHRSRLSKGMAAKDQAKQVATFRYGRQAIFRYRNQTFWAENGLIQIVDEQTGENRTVSISEFLNRALATWLAAKREKWIDDREAQKRAARQMVHCAFQARQQGDPFEVKSSREAAHDKRYIGELVDVDLKPTSSRPKLVLSP